MFCPHCGAEYPKQARFCHSCGQAVPASSAGSGRTLSLPSLPVRGGLPLALAAVVVVILAIFLYGQYAERQREGAYARAQTALSERDWEAAVNDLRAAGSFARAKDQLPEAESQLAQVKKLYEKANQEESAKSPWKAAYDLRRVVEQAPKFRDAPKRLEKLREQIGRIVYSTSDSSSTTLWVAWADGGEAKQLLTMPISSPGSAPAQPTLQLNPTRAEIAVLLAREQRQSLYTFDLQSGEQHEVATAQGLSLVGYQPDGKAIYLISCEADCLEGQSTRRLIRIDLATRERREVYAPSPSLRINGQLIGDGKQIVLTEVRSAADGGNTLALVDLASGQAREIARNAPVTRISPTSSRLFYTQPYLDQTTCQRGVQDFLVDLQTGKATNLGKSAASTAAFLPSGSLITATNGFDNGQTALNVVASPGGNVTQLAEIPRSDWDYIEATPLKPDGFLLEIAGQETSKILKVSGSGAPTELTRNSGGSWVLVSGTILYARTEPGRQSLRLYASDANGQNPRELAEADSFFVTTSRPGGRVFIESTAASGGLRTLHALSLDETRLIRLASGASVIPETMPDDHTVLISQEDGSDAASSSILAADLEDGTTTTLVDNAQMSLVSPGMAGSPTADSSLLTDSAVLLQTPPTSTSGGPLCTDVPVNGALAHADQPDEWSFELDQPTRVQISMTGAPTMLQLIAPNGQVIAESEESEDDEVSVALVRSLFTRGVYRLQVSGANGQYQLRLTRSAIPDRIAYTNADTWGIYAIAGDGTAPALLTNLATPGQDAFMSAWSPDGQRLAYVAGPGAREGTGWGDIYILGADGADVAQITHDRRSQSPAWSPDGKQIAFVSNRDGSAQIYLMAPDGSHVRRITNDPTDNGFPAWSPDGRRIAFVSLRDGFPEIYVMNADGSSPIRLTDDIGVPDLLWFQGPAWSPDGRRIAFSSDQDFFQILTMNADGTNITLLTKDDRNHLWPTWSPDGKRIAFVAGGLGFANQDITQVFIMNADGSNVQQITKTPASKGFLSWGRGVP